MNKATRAILDNIIQRDRDLVPLDGSPLDEAEADRRVLVQFITENQLDFLKRFRAVNVQRARNDFKTLENAGIMYFTTALAGECGELGELVTILAINNMLNAKVGSLCNLLKKLERHKIGGPDQGFTTKVAQITPAKLRDEVGGIMAYLDLLCELISVDIEEATTECFNHVSEAIGSEYRV